MPEQKVAHNRPTVGSLEIEMATQVLQSGQLAQAHHVEAFEHEFCDYLGIARGCAVAVSSGTAALYLALLALGASKKSVAYPVYACAALRNATALANGRPMLVDSSSTSPNIDVTAIARDADIVIAPHLFGMPQDLSVLPQECAVIEDCAQSLGAHVNGVPVGLQREVGVFSFFATKLLTTGGQGGMIVSKNRHLIDYVKDYRLYDGRADANARFNFQMTELQAAIGRAQLQQLPVFIRRRVEIYERYVEAGLPLLRAAPVTEPVRFRAILQTTKPHEVMNALARQQITAVVPIHAAMLQASCEQFPHAYHWAENTVSLPIYPLLTDADVARIIKAVQTIV